MADCVAGCLVTVASTDFDFGGCGLTSSIRSAYIKNFLALRCDQTIPDITDSTAIAAQVSAGTLFASPVLTGEIPFPTTGDEITENCQAPQPTSRTYAFNFDSVRVDVEGLTDFSSWDKVSDSLTSWTIAPVTCDNLLLVPQDFATTGKFFEMRGTISTVFDNTTAQKWRGELQFKYNFVLNGQILTSSVLTALGLSGSAIT